MKLPATYPEAEKPPENAWRRALWRIRHIGLRAASQHYVLVFARWYVGALSMVVTYPDGMKVELKENKDAN